MIWPSPGGTPAYERQAKLFRDLAAEDFASGAVREAQVPYQSGHLPAWRLAAPVAGGLYRHYERVAA